MSRPGAYKEEDALHPADPGIALYVSKLRARYGTHDMPIEDVRRLVGESMGDVKLSDILYKMRAEDDVV